MNALGRRVASSLAVMFGLSVLVFFIFFVTPGADPAARIAGRGASAATLEAVRKDFGLDQALPVQYAIMMKQLFVTGGLTSFVNRGEKVIPQVLRAAPVTLALVSGGAVLWLAGGLLIGLVSALAQGRSLDRLIVSLGLLGVSTPAFWLAEMANLVTQSRYHNTWLFSWVPPLGNQLSVVDARQWLLSMIIPWLTLAVLFAGVYGSVLRTSLADILHQDYIRTARSIGATELRVVLRHALRLSMISIVALFGLDFGALIGGGTLLTEVVFGLHGVGRLIYDALQNLDLPVIMATVLYSALLIVAVNGIADVVQIILDPRLQ